MQLNHTLDKGIYTAKEFIKGYPSKKLVIFPRHPFKIVLILFAFGRVDRKFLFAAEVLYACQTL